MPILFAVVALLLNVQQASASVQGADTVSGIVHVDQQHAARDQGCALHVTGCCSVSMGLVAEGSLDITYLPYHAAFELDAGSSRTYASRRSKQFRPPRPI